MSALAALRDGLDPRRAAPHTDARLAALRGRLWAAPAWRDHLRAAGSSPDDLRSLADLAHVPPLDRRTWRDRWLELLADPHAEGLSVVRSSGSTAAPVSVWRDPGDRAFPYVVMRFAAARVGRPLPEPFGVWFVDRLPGGATGRVASIRPDGGGLWRSGPRDDLTDGPDADVISTDPGGLAALLGVPVRAPRLVWTCATALSPALRAAAEAHLQAPIVDVYAATEVGPIALSCPVRGDRWHVLVPEVHVDAVDGELVVTRLRDSALPVLRWRSGDRGRVIEVNCPCGAHGPTIEGLRGRAPAPFVRPDGRRVDAWALAPALRGLRLDAFGVIQRAPRRFVVGADGDLEGAIAAVSAALVALGWDAPEVVRGPPPSPGDKLPFRSEVQSPDISSSARSKA